LKAYEHYFQAIHHAQMQDVLHEQLDHKMRDYIQQAQQKKPSARRNVSTPKGPARDAPVDSQEIGWGDLLAFGGDEHG
jgi:hypothetical protein